MRDVGKGARKRRPHWDPTANQRQNFNTYHRQPTNNGNRRKKKHNTKTASKAHICGEGPKSTHSIHTQTRYATQRSRYKRG